MIDLKVRKVSNNVFEESTASVSSLKMEVKGSVVQPHTMKTYIGGVEVQLLSFLTEVLDRFIYIYIYVCVCVYIYIYIYIYIYTHISMDH